ncbi:MAG TPA: hypothetical protein GXZ20_03980 [Halanaerobiaceae bacterium]|jgi:hypothetical protein|nr:hypothetical protein [Bacillota bacterium]HHU92284.1 hypothetical protein [Halanaerobiaceae bacterium]
MIENIIENIIIYLTLSIISFYAAYKYQKNSEYALKFFGGKSLVSYLFLLACSFFIYSIILEIFADSDKSYELFKLAFKFMHFLIYPLTIIDNIYYKIQHMIRSRDMDS